jgi:3-keto-5-aminohexanoate cleavage enzyme
MREDGTFIMPPDLVPVDPLEEVIRQLRCRGVAFHIGMRDIGNMRYLEKYRQIGILDREVVIKPFFDEGLNGPTPDARGILMYLDSVPEDMSYRWLVTLAGGRPGGSTLRRLTSLAAAMGGHVRTGLGDNPRLDDNGTYTNVDHVRIAAEIAQGAGRRLATIVEARAMLGITKRIGCPAASDGVSA